jgi:hypothetical protein
MGFWGVDLSGTLHAVVRTGEKLGLGTVSAINVFSTPTTERGQSRSVDTINGNLAFGVAFTDGSSAIYSGTPEASGFDLDPVAQTGEPDATGIANTEWSGFGSPAVDANGTIVFRGILKSTSKTDKITASNDAGIWIASGSTVTLVARGGDAAPGAGGAVFATLADPVVNNDDQVAFIGSLEPAKNLATAATASGIWATTSGTLQLVARQGEAAAGVAGGKYSAFSQVVLPDGGGPVFVATLSGVKAGTNTGLWSIGADGQTRLLGQTGDIVDVHGKSEVVRSFSIFTVAPQVAGQSRNFDASTRLIALVATFNDGTWAVLQGVAP